MTVKLQELVAGGRGRTVTELCGWLQLRALRSLEASARDYIGEDSGSTPTLTASKHFV